MKPSSIVPGDHVIITRPERRGDKRSRVTTDGDGVVLAVYPRFVLVQLKHYRECFWYDEVEAVKRRRDAA